MKSVIHELPVTLRMLRVKSKKSDWLRARNEFPAHAQKSDLAAKRQVASGDQNVP